MKRALQSYMNICDTFSPQNSARSIILTISSHRTLSSSGYQHQRIPPRRTAMSSSRWNCAPRMFPTSGFELVDPTTSIEEETLPTYSSDKYYPVHLGQIFNKRYQVLAKLGYGVTSTVWLGRDLFESRYAVLKMYVLGRGREHELNIYNHINSVETDHPGRKFIRKMFDDFFVEGPNGRHICLVHEPLGINVTELLRHFPTRTMTLEGMKPAIRQLLGVLDFLHSVAGIIHTGTAYLFQRISKNLDCEANSAEDLQLKNLLVPAPSLSALADFEEREIKKPTARKVFKDRTIYFTSRFPSGDGLPCLADFKTTDNLRLQ